MTFTENCFWDNQVFIAWSLVIAGKIFEARPSRVARGCVADRQADLLSAIGALVEASVARRLADFFLTTRQDSSLPS